MLIPSKHSGYLAGVRLYPGGGGDGGGGSSGEAGAAAAGAGPAGPGDATVDGAGAATGGGGGGGGGYASGEGGYTHSGGGSGYTSTGTSTSTGGALMGALRGDSPGPGFPFRLGGAAAGGSSGGSSGGKSGGVPPGGQQSNPHQPQYQNYSTPMQSSQYQNYGSGNPMGISQFGQQAAMPTNMGQMYTPFNPYTNSYGGGMGMGMQSPFGYNPGYGGQFGQMGMQQQYQPQQFYPQYQPPQMQQAQAQPAPYRASSGPTKPIVSRSAQYRSTPIGMPRYAGGGIAGLLK